MKAERKAPPLTPGQLALVDQYLAEWPEPERLVRARYPALWRAVEASGLTAEDARAAAMEGVVRAARKFDPGDPRKASFSTYANYWARARVGRAVHEFSWRQRKLGRKVSGDKPAGEKGDGTLWDVLGLSDPTAPQHDPAEFDRLAAIRGHVAEALRFLDPRRRRIIELRYGLDRVGEAMTLEEVGAALGITRERVRQLEAKAMDQIEDRLRLANELRPAGYVRRTPVSQDHANDAPACPKCGTPYRNPNWKRCYECNPARKVNDRELKAEAGREVAKLPEGLQLVQAGRTQVEVADRRLGGLCEIREARYREAVAVVRELWAKLGTDGPDLAGGTLTARVNLILAESEGV